MDNMRNFYNNLSYFINDLTNCISDYTQYVDLENNLQILNESDFFLHDFAPYEIEKLEDLAQDFFEKLDSIPEYVFLNYGESEEIMKNLAHVFISTVFRFSMDLDDIIIPAQERVQRLIDFRCTIKQYGEKEIFIEFYS